MDNMFSISVYILAKEKIQLARNVTRNWTI